MLTLTVPTPTRPIAPIAAGDPAVIDPVEQEIFKEKIWMYVKIESSIETTMKSLYDLLWGQCSKTLRSRLRGHDDYIAYSTSADSMELLKAVRAKMTGCRNKQYLPLALHKIMRDFYSLSQGKHCPNQEYYDEFNSLVNTAEDSGATIGIHPAGVNEVLPTLAANSDNPTMDKQASAIKAAGERYLAVAFLLGSDRVRYGTLVEEISNKFLRNKGSSSTAGMYPTTVAEAYDYLCNYRKDPQNLARLLGQNSGNNANLGVAFVQEAEQQIQDHDTQEQTFITNGGGGNGNSNEKKVCRQCGADGHTSINCNTGQDKVDIFRQSQQPNQGVSQLIHAQPAAQPVTQGMSQLIHAVDWDGIVDNLGNEGQNFTFLNNNSFKQDGPIDCTEYDKHGQVAQVHKTTVFSQANSEIPDTWYLLDNQSMCDIISNFKLGTNDKSKDTCSCPPKPVRPQRTGWRTCPGTIDQSGSILATLPTSCH
jgi:hypothetical protein